MNDRLIGLLDEWEEQRRVGSEPTPEQLCPDDLVAREELARRIARRRHVLALLGTASDVETDPATPGRLGPFRLLEVIGRGGMGTVYRAFHERLGREVALKVIRAEQVGDSSARTRFEREMAALGGLDHPRIVKALHADELDGVLYLAMERVEGVDLAKLVRRLGPLPVAEASELARQVAEILDGVHRRGLVHRDLKPSNLMLDPSGIVILLDLGLALVHPGRAVGPSDLDQELTLPGQLLGTPAYMAPEQVLHAHNADLRSDLYALGAMLYKFLTGRLPKPECLAELSGRPGVEIPPRLARLLGRLMADRPEDRPGSAAEVARALAPFARGHNLTGLAALYDRSAPGPLAAGPSRTRGRRIRAAHVGMGMAASAVLLASGALWLLAVRASTSADRGILLVRSPVDGLNVAVRRGDEIVSRAILKVGDNLVSLRPGGYELLLDALTPGGLSLDRDRFELRPDDSVIVNIRKPNPGAPPGPVSPQPAATKPAFVSQWEGPDRKVVENDLVRQRTVGGLMSFAMPGPASGKYLSLVEEDRTFPEGIIEATCRVASGGGRGAWLLNIEQKDHHHGAMISLFGDGRVRIGPSGYDRSPEAGPVPRIVTSEDVGQAGRWNTVRVVVKGNAIQVHINGRRVAAPVETGFLFTPSVVSIGVQRGDGTDPVEVQTRRVRFWPTTELADLPPWPESPPAGPEDSTIAPTLVEEWNNPRTEVITPCRFVVKDGIYSIEMESKREGIWAWNVCDFADGTIELKGRVAGGSFSGWVLNIGRLLGETDGSGRGARFVVLPDGTMKISTNMFDKDTSRDPLSLFPLRHPAIRPAGEWNTLRVVVKANTISAYMNGSLILAPTALSKSVTPGRLGLGLTGPGPGGRGRVEFDQLLLWPTTNVDLLPR